MSKDILEKFIPPTADHLSRMYFELAQCGALALGERKSWPYGKVQDKEGILVLALEMSRYDPRLFGILVEFFYFHWHEWNPYHLRMVFNKIKTPQIGCVIAEFILAETQDKECRYFFEYLIKGQEPVQAQLFFKSLHEPASKGMQKAAFESIQEFFQWGFLASERPIIHAGQRLVLGHWHREARQNIIYRLARDNKKFSVSDYLAKVDHSISRQQALTDLKDSPHVFSRGKGRGSFYLSNI